MTQERAKYLLANMRYGSFPMAFARKCDLNPILDPNGITPEEDREIKKIWDTMPGWASYYDVVCCIAYPENWM